MSNISDAAPWFPPAAARVVLLGASNLTLGLPTILEAIGKLFAGPIEILGALGYGRSYGKKARILWWRFPGIEECGIWKILEAAPPRPTFALVTDVGNDIGYGVEVPQILAWVRASLERLVAVESRTLMTLLPVESLGALSPWKYRLFRRLLFPSCQLPQGEVLQRARELNESLRNLGRATGAAVVEPERRWYGLDPIHIRRSLRREAWRSILERWVEPRWLGGRWTEAALPFEGRLPPAQPRAAGLSIGWTAAQLLRPEIWWRFGRERRTPQPCRAFGDGTTLALY